MAIKTELTEHQVQMNIRLLDLIKDRFRLRYGNQLAAVLNISPENVCKIRSGLLAIGPTMQIHMHEVLGLSFKEIREYIPPPVSRKTSTLIPKSKN